MDDIEFYKFFERSEKTGLLFQTAASKFESNHIRFTDANNELIPEIITKEDWLYSGAKGNSLKLVVDSTETQEDVDEYWLDQLQNRIKQNGNSEIFDGTVLQTVEVTDETLFTNTTTFFTVASHRESYAQSVAQSIIDGTLIQQKDRSVADIDSNYSLIGATYTVVIDSPKHSSRYILLGKRHKNMNTLSEYFTCCPAGILEKRHSEEAETENIVEAIRNHFEEELNEEMYNNTLDESQLSTTLDNSAEFTIQGIGIDPLRFATELAVTVEISGDFATELLDTNQYQLNGEFEYISPIRLQDLTLEKNLPYQLTPQSMFSLGLFLTKEGDVEREVLG